MVEPLAVIISGKVDDALMDVEVEANVPKSSSWFEMRSTTADNVPSIMTQPLLTSLTVDTR